MARPARLERATLCLEGRCSIQLSYGRSFENQALTNAVFDAPQIVPRSTMNGKAVLLSMTKKELKNNRASLWEPTRYPNLFRYVPSGTIFARLKARGKQVRKSLKTQNLELAKNKLAELERNERAITQERRKGRMLFGEALAEHIKSLKCDPTLKPGTKDYDDRGPRPFTRPGPAWRALIFAGSTRWNASDGLANSTRKTRRRLIITRLLWSNMRSTRLLRRASATTILPNL